MVFFIKVSFVFFLVAARHSAVTINNADDFHYVDVYLKYEYGLRMIDEPNVSSYNHIL